MPWTQISFLTDARHAAELEEHLNDLGATAVTMQDAEDQPILEPGPGEVRYWPHTRITGLFDNDTDTAAIRRQLSAKCGQDQFPEWQVTQLEDQDWERAWLDSFHPMQFGQRLWVIPSTHTPPNPEGINLFLDPGLAFGTGTHATTALCLEWIDGRDDLHDLQVVDFGCGSGILAIAAALKGAKEIQAIDIDPQALTATRDNAERNKVSGSIHTYLPKDAPEVEADIVLANILAGPLQALAPELTRRVRPGGWIVLSGILSIDQAEAVLDAYRPGFDMEAVVTQEDWVRLTGRRRTPTPQ